jgi:acetyl-CoA C-acetyltransferase
MPTTLRRPDRPVVVTHALRTAIGKFLGSFADLSAADLGACVVTELFARSGLDPARVDELVFGNGRQAGGGPNVARQVAVRSGIPVERTAWTMNMACGSGLKSLGCVVDSIQLGRTEIAVAGGTESMSGLPFFLPKMRQGYRLGHAKVVDAMYQDGFDCPLAGMVMGETAEKLAQDLGITREEQDEFALASQHKSQAARAAGRFADELVPVTVKTRQGEVVVDADEHPRDDATMEGLAKLPPVFDRKTGTVTAGNASGITDGAAALLVMTADKAEELGLEPLAFIGERAEAGVDPKVMGIGPVPAVNAMRQVSGRGPAHFDLIELNEAFAAQVLACHRDLDLPMDRLNVNGGSISLGHPIGATGARIVATLLHELKRRGGTHGLATLCISGGQGLAYAFHREGL